MEPKRLTHRALTEGSSLKPSRRKGLRVWYLPLACIVVFLGLQPRLGATEDLSAKEIVRRMTSISDRAKDGTSRARMVLIDSKGAKIDRTVTTYRLTLENGSKSLIVFNAPSDVKGTALLVWSYEDKDDEQWLYLPAYERVRRITSSGKGEGFAGSDLSFSDLEERGLEEFRYSKGPDVNEGASTATPSRQSRTTRGTLTPRFVTQSTRKPSFPSRSSFLTGIMLQRPSRLRRAGIFERSTASPQSFLWKCTTSKPTIRHS